MEEQREIRERQELGHERVTPEIRRETKEGLRLTLGLVLAPDHKGRSSTLHCRRASRESAAEWRVTGRQLRNYVSRRV